MKEYKKESIAVTWEQEKCIHAANCVKGLPNVFQPKSKPWIHVDGASEEEIITQVSKCPSGALGIKHV